MPFMGTNGSDGVPELPNGSSHGQDRVMPIAIVGMGCRLPGDVSTPDEFWMMCARARSGWSEIPKSRFSQDAYYHPNPGKTGTHNAKGGHFLTEDIGLFDAPFFNVTAAEARALDPQQRLMLEVTFEALESAGIPKSEVVGRNVGVFMGAYGADYEQLNARDIETAPMYLSTGCSSAIVSNRLSYYFDMRGPSFTIDTACSSSLTALHVACQSLRNGECPMAVVGGVHLNIGPDTFVTMGLQRLFSDSGKSYAFDHKGVSGFGRGEGAGCIILKPLDEAIKSKDVIRAVITNTGINQDGRTNGITVPNGESQEELMRSVYAKANISVEDVGFVEAHGTGTKVGDPIEARTLHSVFATNRTPKTPLYVGSVKSNIGHAEAASGVVSVIKAAMMLERGFILPNADWEKFPDSIPSSLNLKVPVKQRPWPKDKKYISVNNFGYGGANAHVVLEKAPRPGRADTRETSPTEEVKEPQRRLFVLSANDEKSTLTKMKDLLVYTEQRPETFEKFLTRNLAYTLGERRSVLPWKVAMTAVNYDDIIQQLSAGTLRPTRAVEEPKIGFAYTGQGAQWHAMGRELMVYPVFSSALKTADILLTRMGASFSLLDELSKDAKSSSVNEAHISQPICTAVQLALTDLLGSWNIHPTAVTGHSSGEIGAAYAAGALTLESAMAIAYHRGLGTINLKEKFPALKGTMMAIGAGPSEIQPLLDSLSQGRVVVACINSPSSITASGDEPAIAELQKIVEEKQIFNRRLRVDVAYHSHHMQLIAEDYHAAIKDVVPVQTTEIRFHSSLLGRQIDTRELGPTYWVENLTSAVRFSESVADMCVPPSDDTSSKPRVDIVVEVGPHAALEGPIKQILKANGISTTKLPYASTLSRNKDAVETAQTLAATLFMRGCSLKMPAINLISPGSRDPALLNDLPRYPFNHDTRYWHVSRIGDQHCFKKSIRNDIVGTLADYSSELSPQWRNIIRADDIPWVRHHKMQSMTVYPIAGYIAMALEAASQRAISRGIEFVGKFNIRELVVSRPLVIGDDAEVETTITLKPYQEGTRNSSDVWDEFTVSSWSSDRGWIEHCHGLVAVQKSKDLNSVSGQYDEQDAKRSLSARLCSIREQCSTEVDIKKMYEALSAAGATYGETFQGLENGTASDGYSVGDIVVPNTVAIMPQGYEVNYIIHPAFLDIFLHAMWPIFGAGRSDLNTLYMPSSVKNITISPGISKDVGSRLRAYATGFPNVSAPKPTLISLYATALDSTDEALITFEDMTMSPVLESGDASESALHRELCYGLEWVPAVAEAETAEGEVATAESEVVPVTNGAPNGSESHPPGPRGPKVTIVFREKDQSILASGLAKEIETLTGIKPQLSTLTDATTPESICIMLAELDEPFLAKMSPELFKTIHQTVTTAEALLWIVRGANGKSTTPDSNMINGFARSVRSETNLKFATLDLDGEARLSDEGVVSTIFEVFKSIFLSTSSTNSDDMEYRERDGKLLVPRITEDAGMDRFVHREISGTATLDLQPFYQPERPLKIKVGTPGALDTLHFIDDLAVGAQLAPQEVEIEVKATSMNFKDIMISMGQLSSEYLGIECAGVISRIGSEVVGLSIGDRVCASTEGAYATFTRCNYTSVARISDEMSLEEAATIPIVFCTAYYSLFDLGRLTKGETVLIHAAAGGVGQAAIMLAKHAGAEIYATVGSESKKAFIMERYGVPEDHIFYSRDTSFGPAVRRATKGRGVDVILNSLASDLLRETWDCIAHFGRFVEIGKRDIVGNSRLEMRQFDYNATFSSVDLTVVAAEKPQLMKRLLDDVFVLLNQGVVKPIAPINVHPISEVETAFRLLQSGKAMGKLVIVPSKEDQVKATSFKTPDDLLRPDATYLLIGGTGGLGRSMSRWMVSKGARHLVLLSRSGSTGGKVGELIEELRVVGATIIVRSCDIADRDQVDAVLKGLSDLPPVRGLIHGAMVLNDTLFENMTYSAWHDVVTPKVAGAWNFHNALQALSTPLDFFIMLSSTAGVIGNRGQAAYAAANTFLDSFASFRRSQGLAAVSVDLTAVSDVGILAEDSERRDATAQNFGSETLVEKEVLALLAAAISGKTTQKSACQIITGLYVAPETLESNFWIRDRKFAELRKAAESALVAAGTGIGPTVSLDTAVKTAKDENEAETIIYEALAAKVSAVLMVPLEEMNPASSVASYGLDSLVAIEIRNWISRELGANFQVLELLTSPTMKALVKTILEKRNKA